MARRPGWRRVVATNTRGYRERSRLFAKRGKLPLAGYQAVLFSGRPDGAGSLVVDGKGSLELWGLPRKPPISNRNTPQDRAMAGEARQGRLPALFRPGRRYADGASGGRNEGPPAARHGSRPSPLARIRTAQAGGELTAMPLTRDFKETIRTRTVRDPDFREALLEEGVQRLLAGDVETGKSVLRDYNQHDDRISGARRTDRQVAKEPDAYARSARQSPSPQPVGDYRPPSRLRGTASDGSGRAVIRPSPRVARPRAVALWRAGTGFAMG